MTLASLLPVLAVELMAVITGARWVALKTAQTCKAPSTAFDLISLSRESWSCQLGQEDLITMSLMQYLGISLLTGLCYQTSTGTASASLKHKPLITLSDIMPKHKVATSDRKSLPLLVCCGSCMTAGTRMITFLGRQSWRLNKWPQRSMGLPSCKCWVCPPMSCVQLSAAPRMWTMPHLHTQLCGMLPCPARTGIITECMRPGVALECFSSLFNLAGCRNVAHAGLLSI